jgi:hypothetical protein
MARRRRRRSSSRRTKQQSKFAKAARACKGRGRGFKACMRKKLRKGRR